MCVLFIAKQVSNRYPLIIIANRDEFYARPATAIHQWPDSPIVAGQDLQAGGTWLGISASGKIAALTNIRNPLQLNPQAISRGDLVTNFLTAKLNDHQIKQQLLDSASHYNGYNLLFGDAKHLEVFNSATLEFSLVSPGIHGLSNAAFNTPWPKVTLGKKLLADYLKQDRPIECIKLAQLLTNSQLAKDDQLPDTGIPIQFERALSPLFIHNQEKHYGTRCTSVLLFDQHGHIDFYEASYDQHGQLANSKHIKLQQSSIDPLSVAQ